MALGGSGVFSITLIRNILNSSSSMGLHTGKATCWPWLLPSLADKIQGLALKYSESWIFIHTQLDGRKRSLLAVSVTQTKALGSTRQQLFALDLCLLSCLEKVQVILLCSRVRG